MNLVNRIAYLSISLVLLIGLSNFGYSNKYLLDAQNNGFLFFFFSNLQVRSEDYSVSNTSTNSTLRNMFLSKEDNYIKTEEKPNIVVIMNEAFWNPKVLNNIKFSKDPTPNIDRLKTNSISGYLESSEFGGGTANAEFELLTGNSVHFYEPGLMMYTSKIKEPFMALPSILKTQGYNTKAIHPYRGWFWNRREVYKYLGFDEFLSEEYLVYPEYKGFYISDNYSTELIIDELKNSPDPTFVFAVTMQNHGQYNDTRYEDHNQKREIDILNNITPDSLQILKTYCQGVYDADKALGKLIDYCKSSKRPTIVLLFGDHLPMLGPDLQVYKEFDYVKGNIENTDKLKLASVPFVLWSNYNNKHEDIGILNMSFMGPYLLKYAGLDMPEYFNFLDNFSKEIPVISRTYAIDKNGTLIDYTTEEYKKYNEAYKKFQFDIMNGSNNLGKDTNNWTVRNNTNYNAKLNSILINNIKEQDDKVIIEGNNLYSHCNLYINDKKQDFHYVDNNTIHILDKQLSNNDKLQLKLFDSNNDLITESNVYNFLK